MLENGFFTVEFKDGSYRTLRISDWRNRGIKLISFLFGPDNTKDYQGCADLNEDGTFRLWRRYSDDGMLFQSIVALLNADRAEMTEAFARRSGRCSRCGRTLTVPASLNRGLGPECATKVA